MYLKDGMTTSLIKHHIMCKIKSSVEAMKCFLSKGTRTAAVLRSCSVGVLKIAYHAYVFKEGLDTRLDFRRPVSRSFLE